MASKKCQCDELCTYYQSCCADYMEQCKPQGEFRALVGKPRVPSATGNSLLPTLPAVTRGDVFTMPEDEYGNYDYLEESKNDTSNPVQLETTPLHPRLQLQTEGASETTPLKEQAPTFEESTLGPEVGYQEVPGTTEQGTSEFLEEELCSGKPFDAFTDLKNGSLFAFRGDSMDRSGVGGSLLWDYLLLTRHPLF